MHVAATHQALGQAAAATQHSFLIIDAVAVSLAAKAWYT
tara:strand:- start:160 stop:276 length:117 start_codon:yes stop_codon:yes gene_type:complete